MSGCGVDGSASLQLLAAVSSCPIHLLYNQPSLSTLPSQWLRLLMMSVYSP